MTLSFLQIAVYFLLIESISVLRSASFDSVVIDISGNLFLRTLNILALIIGFSIIYFTPGLLWIAKKKDCTLWESSPFLVETLHGSRLSDLLLLGCC